MKRIDEDKKIIVITGGGGGIGGALAESLATRAGFVAVADKELHSAETVAQRVVQLGKPSRAYELDVTDAAATRGMINLILREFGRIDVMCANAGIIGPGPFEETTDADFDRVLDVNTKGVIYACQAVVESMIQQRSGRILVTASYNAFRTGTHVVPYRVSKAALIMYVKCLALALAPHMVTVNALCPGVTLTEMQRSYASGAAQRQQTGTEEYLRRRRDAIPMKEFTDVKDIVNLARFLISDGARLITGQAIAPDGGVLASS